MKILAFGDLHDEDLAVSELVKRIRKLNPDVLVSVGDIVNYKKLTELVFDGGFGGLWVCVHGNNDNLEDIQARLKDYSQIKYLDKNKFEIGGLVFGGFGGVIGEKRRNFSKSDLKNILDGLRGVDILVSHVDPESGGGDLIMDFVKENNVKYWFYGHKHSGGGVFNQVGGVILVNASKPVFLVV